MKRFILYKAGPGVIDRIRDEGLPPGRVRVFAGPAGGPKWFVSVGFDRALMRTGFLRRSTGRVLLVGSSAGGWRCLAMACRAPEDAYEKLRIAYSRNVFTASDTALSIRLALKGNVEAFIGDEDIPHILRHDSFDTAVHTVRAKGLAGSDLRLAEGAALGGYALLNSVTPNARRLFYERVVFFSGRRPPAFISRNFDGMGARMTRRNVRAAALATGALPYFIAGVNDIPDAPPGTYRDGGLTDYQLNQDYLPGPDGLTLMFHYQERIIPGWFDKKLSRRTPSTGALERLLLAYPSPEFVKLLPDGRIPDRKDFIDFVDNPLERIRRWDETSHLSSLIGEQFMEDCESGRIRELVKPLKAQIKE